jgi:hypothetical protein
MPRARTAVAGLAALSALASCSRLATNISGAPGPEAGLLRGKTPVRSSGAMHVDRLTDGIAAMPGDFWRTDLTTVLGSPAAFVTYDLGQDVPIRCAQIQSDGDDQYLLSVSSDGHSFAPLWTAAPTGEAGMQLRLGQALGGIGRYLRLAAAGGDGRYAVAEVGVWSACPARWPAVLAVQKGTPVAEAIHTKIWAFAALAALFLLTYRRRAPDFIKLLAAVPIGVGLSLSVQLGELWPPEAPLRWQLLAAIGVIAAAAGVRLVAQRIFAKRPSKRTAKTPKTPRGAKDPEQD